MKAKCRECKCEFESETIEFEGETVAMDDICYSCCFEEDSLEIIESIEKIRSKPCQN